MPFTKKLQKLGSGRGLLVNRDLLAMLDFEENELDDAYVSITVLGDTLLLRRADKPPLTPQEAAYALSKSPEFAAYWPSSPRTPPPGDPPPEPLFKASETVKLTAHMRQALQALRELGEASSGEVAKVLEWKPMNATRQLRSAEEKGLVLRQGRRYRLNPEYFKEEPSQPL